MAVLALAAPTSKGSSTVLGIPLASDLQNFFASVQPDLVSNSPREIDKTADNVTGQSRIVDQGKQQERNICRGTSQSSRSDFDDCSKQRLPYT